MYSKSKEQLDFSEGAWKLYSKFIWQNKWAGIVKQFFKLNMDMDIYYHISKHMLYRV